MRYCLGRTDAGRTYALRDSREARIAAAVAAAGNDPAAIVRTLQGLPGLFPHELTGSATWCASVTDALARILQNGMEAAVAEEAKGSS